MQNVTKDIPYLPFHKQEVHDLLRNMPRDAGLVPAVISSMPLYTQMKRGVQLRVEKKLTDELKETELKDIGSEDIRPMWPSMEIYFEDAELPTILFYHKDAEYQRLTREYMYPVTFDFGRDDSICMDYYKGMYNFTIQLPPAMMDDWLKDELHEAPLIPGFIQMTPEEEKYKRFLFRLVCKVLLYASIPEYRPLEVRGQDIMVKRWGKPGYKDRPRTKVFKVLAPSVVVDRPHREESDGTGTTIPHRRKGHIRRLMSEKFKSKRGQIIFIRPCLIHGGSLDDRIYMIRKKENENGKV